MRYRPPAPDGPDILMHPVPAVGVSFASRESVAPDVGDAVSMSALFSRYRTPAIALATRICGAALAEDAVQDAFFSIWRSSATFEPERGNLSAWVLGIVRNRAIDALRRDTRHSRRRANAETLDFLAEPGQTHAIVIDRDHACALRMLLTTLPDDQARVIDLAFFEDLTHTEIADRLRLPLGTVKGRLRLGLARLRGRGGVLAAEPSPRPVIVTPSSAVAGALVDM